MFLAGCILIGLTAGFLSALLGVGGGVVIVPMLLLLLGVEMKVAIGTSLACIVPIALSGAFLKHSGGHVEWKIVLLAVPFGILGVYLGDKVSAVASGPLLKRLFGVLLLLVAVKMVLFPGGWEGLLMPGAQAQTTYQNGSVPPQETQPHDSP